MNRNQISIFLIIFSKILAEIEKRIREVKIIKRIIILLNKTNKIQ